MTTIAKLRNTFDPHYHRWIPALCIDIGRPDDTTIPAEFHPAFRDDLTEAELALFADERRRWVWQKGEAAQAIREFMLTSIAQATVVMIAKEFNVSLASATAVLKRNPSLFKIIDYKVHPHGGKAAIWALRT